MLTLKSCWAILYFVKDRQFAILPPADILYDALQPCGDFEVDALPKTRVIKVLGKYDDQFYEGIIVQCAMDPSYLQDVIGKVRKYKTLKHFKIERILDIFERYNTGRRTKANPIDVSRT